MQMASPNYIIFLPPPFPKINHKTTLNRVRALPSSREERWERAQRGAGRGEVPHALCSTYGTWEHPLLGELGSGPCSGCRLTLHCLRLDPRGSAGRCHRWQWEGGRGSRGAACAGGITEIPCSPEGHSPTCMLLAADFSLLLAHNFIPFRSGQGGSILFVLVGPRSPTNTCAQEAHP